ncbi:MAG TPA: stage II sporulation protein M [Chitinophagaceae bacterium]|nr:stage II sporulation protein M [Chitinophagaceae bacterium]
MREARFLKINAAKWERFDQELSIDPDPDLVATRFIELTDDLAFARTFYPGSRTVSYLNSLAARFHRLIYKNKKEKISRFPAFWKYELPLLMYIHRRQLYVAFLFFLVFCLIGWVSASRDDSFIRLILGNGYVNMTNANITKGDPFGVYRQGNPFNMFLYIAYHNISVSFTTFVLGILGSAGTLCMMFYNGIMLGSFEYYFFAHHLGGKSITVIFIHGTLEISAMVIAGCAGLILGNSLLFPGTYSRLTSLRRGVKDGLKMVIGIVPVFLIAAFFEGFVTRHIGMPLWLRFSILFGSVSGVIWYFIIYPGLLYKRVRQARGAEKPNREEKLDLWISKNWNFVK